MCQVYGEPHYITFDGASYEFEVGKVFGLRDMGHFQSIPVKYYGLPVKTTFLHVKLKPRP